MKLSIVIVHYQAPDMINQLIQSIENDRWNGELEYIVVDNSSDLLKEQLCITSGNLKLLKPGYNSGFARGVNLGMNNAIGDFIVVINQDAYFYENSTLKHLIEQAEILPLKTILSCRIWSDSGEFQNSIWLDNPDLKREWKFGAIHYKLFPNWKDQFEQEKRAIHQRTGYVPRVNGAFFILRNDEYVQEALFDEDFFLYGEDVEWALRIKKKGWRFYYLSDISIKHIGSASSYDNIIKKEKQIILSSWLTIRKRKGKAYLYFYLLIQFLLNKLDLFLNRKEPNIYLRVKGKNNILKELRKKYLKNIITLKAKPNGFIANCYNEER